MTGATKRKDREICCMCGRSVAEGSAAFEDRERDYGGTVDGRREEGCAFPHGEYVCAGCDALRTEWNRS